MPAIFKRYQPAPAGPSLIVGNSVRCECGRTIPLGPPYFLPEEKPPDYFVMLQSVESTEIGWRVTGKGVVFRGACPYCAQMHSIAARQIPIESEALKCPNCHSNAMWEYQVNKVTRGDTENEFEFQADLVCKKCDRRQVFKKLLGGLFEIIKIEVGPGGITFGKG